MSYKDETGNEVFVGPDPRERLAAALNPRLSTSDLQRQREEAIQAGRSKVDQDPGWEEVRSLVSEAMGETEKLYEATERQREDLKPERFTVWQRKAEEAHAESLLAKTAKAHEALAKVKASYASPAVPMPLTSADAGVLGVRLNILDSASPSEAVALVEDAIQREDRPFLTAAGVKVRSWRGKRNHWSGPEAEAIAERLSERISRETWTPARQVASYAEEKHEMASQAWSQVARSLAKGGAGFEELRAYRSTGALSPLLDPEEK